MFIKLVFVLVFQVTVQDYDQPWIYGTYECSATNFLGDANIAIELRRACEFNIHAAYGDNGV